MTKRKTFDPKLPGRYGKMTEAELSAEADRYDVPGVAEQEAAALAGKPHAPHPKRSKRGRTPMPLGTKAARVLITVEPRLLRRADKFVAQIGETRAGWIQKLMRAAIAAGNTPA